MPRLETLSLTVVAKHIDQCEPLPASCGGPPSEPLPACRGSLGVMGPPVFSNVPCRLQCCVRGNPSHSSSNPSLIRLRTHHLRCRTHHLHTRMRSSAGMFHTRHKLAGTSTSRSHLVARALCSQTSRAPGDSERIRSDRSSGAGPPPRIFKTSWAPDSREQRSNRAASQLWWHSGSHSATTCPPSGGTLGTRRPELATPHWQHMLRRDEPKVKKCELPPSPAG